jgi:transposase
MAERRTFTKEFKANAVELAERGDRSIPEIAQELGIAVNRIYRWRKQKQEAEAGGVKAFPGHGNPRDEELDRLRKENARLREANEILKKAAAIFLERKPQ